MRYWVIAPCDSQRQAIFDKAWEYDKQNGTIAIGWRGLGDISKVSRDELNQAYQRTYGPEAATSETRTCNLLWRFFHEILPGDRVIARRGRKRIVGIGTVTGSAFYDEAKAIDRVDRLSDHWYPNFISVHWETTTEIDLGTIALSMSTMYEIPEEKFRSLAEGSIGEEQEELDHVGPEAAGEFALEKHLEDFMVKNFDRIFKGELALYQDPEGVVGQQYPVIDEDGRESGAIDILAIENRTSDYVVIELKKGRESDRVVGQILRYIGWVQENLCDRGQKVKGIVICSEHDDRLRYAIIPVAAFVQLKRYRVDFQLIDS